MNHRISTIASAMLVAVATITTVPAQAAQGFVVQLPKPPTNCSMIAPEVGCLPTAWIDLRDVRSFRFVVQANNGLSPPADLVLMADGKCLGERCATITVNGGTTPPSGNVPMLASPIISIPSTQQKQNVRLWIALRETGSVMPFFGSAIPVVQFYR